MAVLSSSQDSFQKDVLDGKGFVFVDFYADWCGPCKMTSPIIDELAKTMKEVKFVKVNVDENQQLAGQYSVFSIPTFMIFKNGAMKNQFVGAHSKEGFEEEIKKVMNA
ncbi:MAG: Thioredoxin [Candidatus Roizmanbacteria bacterium GW2011_GWA2_37_7]|uniref:Thioredoxin n=1 Tax=Candidatus Roizmanbacteria bacterium GW2011_GWA2_37_7 TaxID=1618481 RepID=A0A0G0H9S2_9BACT|nr:MAG: Thioredoxin [Candidatus Roizmanbacteria bacterium GW2011_GWA2_37_7]